MLSWLTGPRITNVAEDLQAPDDLVGPEPSYVEPPDTPAPVFAVRAFKHAIWGTPPPPTHFDLSVEEKKRRSNESARSMKVDNREKLDKNKPSSDTTVPNIAKNKIENTQQSSQTTSQPTQRRSSDSAAVAQQPSGTSPTKQAPAGILMTPGTGATRRKTVKFGEHVVDNEGKRKSGIPSNVPGKFPSPWTPKVGSGASTNEDKGNSKTKGTAHSSSNKLNAALQDAARETATGNNAQDFAPPTKRRSEVDAIAVALSSPGAKPTKSRDDADLTIDVLEPRSESGRYWKAQLESYAERSEREIRKLIAKHQLAKEYAKKKDGEAVELRAKVEKLEAEKKRARGREKTTEEQVRDLRERLRAVMGENAGLVGEVSGLKRRVADLEGKSNCVESTGEARNAGATSSRDTGSSRPPSSVVAPMATTITPPSSTEQCQQSSSAPSSLSSRPRRSTTPEIEPPPRHSSTNSGAATTVPDPANKPTHNPTPNRFSTGAPSRSYARRSTLTGPSPRPRRMTSSPDMRRRGRREIVGDGDVALGPAPLALHKSQSMRSPLLRAREGRDGKENTRPEDAGQAREARDREKEKEKERDSNRLPGASMLARDTPDPWSFQTRQHPHQRSSSPFDQYPSSAGASARKSAASAATSAAAPGNRPPSRSSARSAQPLRGAASHQELQQRAAPPAPAPPHGFPHHHHHHPGHQHRRRQSISQAPAAASAGGGASSAVTDGAPMHMPAPAPPSGRGEGARSGVHARDFGLRGMPRSGDEAGMSAEAFARAQERIAMRRAAGRVR
ncbi:spindle pole body formation-associated protein-domain-containing protein [Lineolata rhizophorae]|uniref:Spindle pole body formation-associated protein-domain-containing protein n=1 Tax=Lineolata rhizophorae TaxID=578093 RepID=A0A6A6NZS4_9PEZI|nr:spindle pole body formation-associated protein-domain-containing protein [Lineolata rhizophorae]